MIDGSGTLRSDLTMMVVTVIIYFGVLNTLLLGIKISSLLGSNTLSADKR